MTAYVGPADIRFIWRDEVRERKRVRVAFTRAADLVRRLVEVKDDHQLGRLHRYYQRVQLLIIDELGFVPLNKVEAELLFTVRRLLRRSQL